MTTSTLHNYHDVNGAFIAPRTGFTGYTPDGALTPRKPDICWYDGWGVISGTVALLPFMELQTVYDTVAQPIYSQECMDYGFGDHDPENCYNFTLGWLPGWSYALWRGDALGIGVRSKDSVFSFSIPTLMCPSDPVQNPWLWGRPLFNYSGCIGDSMLNTNETLLNNRGFYGGGCGYKNNRAFRTMASLQDGTSNTIMFGEITIGDTLYSDKVKGGTVVLAASEADVVRVPSACLARGVNPTDKGKLVGTNFLMMPKGSNVFNGGSTMSAFQTILPPNSASCVTEDGFYHNGHGESITSSGSYHPGGANIVMGDGSVRFVADSVDCGDTNWDVRVGSATYGTDGSQPTGKSPFGVWGAMGTIAGGETKSL